MIDWSKVSTPGAPPSGNPQTTTAPIPPTASGVTPVQRGDLTGPTATEGYKTGEGWRPTTQAEVDALGPGDRMARGLDYLGYLLFGNEPDQMGGEQFGHQAPLAGNPLLKDAIGGTGNLLHQVADITMSPVVRPFEAAAAGLARIPMGHLPGYADQTFEELGARLAANPTPMNEELYLYWLQTKAEADADILYGGNLKADFNEEVLTLFDDMQYDSTLGSTPTMAIGNKAVGSLGGAVSHAIESFLGVTSNQSQLVLGQAGVFDPGGSQNTFEDQYRAWQTPGALDASNHSIDVGDEQARIFEMMRDGKITEAEARAKVEQINKGGRNRMDEIAGRADLGLEVTDIEQKALDAYRDGAWSKQHAEEWVVSHGQGITRNPVGQIIGTVVTDPLTWATIGLGGVSAAGKAGLATAEAANVTLTSMKGLSIVERIAASSGNAARIAKAIPNATVGGNAISNSQKIAMGIAAVQKSPAGPVARVARGLVDPFAVYKPNPIQKTVEQLQGQVAVGGLQRAHGPQTFSDLEGIARETGKTTEIRQAAANYAKDQADLMVANEARDQMIQKGYGVEMMDPTSELNSVDDVVAPLGKSYATRDAQTRVADHIVEHSKVTFTEAEEANLAHRIATTIGGGIDWGARVGKMSHDMKALLHAITYKLQETDWYKAMNAIDRNAYDGDLPLDLGAIMDVNTMDGTMAAAAVKDIEAILADTARPDRIEAATALWNDLATAHDRMGNIGLAPGGEKQLQALLREMKSDIEAGAFPKVWTESELAHPALQPLRDSLDRGSIPMSGEEIAAAKAQARKTAEISFKRKAALETRRAELKDALRATLTKSGKVRKGMEEKNLAAQKALEDFQGLHPEAKARFDVQAEARAVEQAKYEDDAYLKGYEAAKRSKTADPVAAKERFAKNHPDNAAPDMFDAGWADAQAGKPFGEALGAGGFGVDNLPPPGSLAPTLDETIRAAEDSVTGVKRLWKVGSRPDETVAWGLKHDVNTGLPTKMREPTISHNFMAYPGKQKFSATTRNALGQIIGTVPANAIAKPIDSMEVFLDTMRDMVTGRRLVQNMNQRFERSMFAAGVPKPIIRTIFTKAKEVAALDQTTIRGLSASEHGGLWKAIADDIPRDLRLADGTALDVHKVMDHLLQAAEGDLRVMGLTSKFSQRMRNALRAANIDPVNYGGQVTVTQYNKMRYAFNPTFIIQRITDSIYYSILYGIHPVGMGALSESNMALRAVTENLARTGMARDFAFDLPEYATRANWTDGVKTALQQAGIDGNMLSKIANAPDVLIQHNMINMLHARLGDIVRGTLDNLATAIEKDATLIAGATPEQAYILRRSFADWRATYSQNAGRVLNDNEVGFMYIKDMLSGWNRIGPIDPKTGLLDFTGLMHEGAMMLPSDVGAIGSLMPDSLATTMGYRGGASALRQDISGTIQKINGEFQHVLGEHDLAWFKEQLVKMGAHPDYIKRATAYFGDTWDNFWFRLSLPLEKGGLDITEHYAKEAQQVIATLARDRGMDPWEYLSGVMLINSGTDSLDTAIGRFVNFLKKGEVSAEPSDWGAFFRSHLDPSAQDTLQAAYANAQDVAAAAASGPKMGDKIVRTESDGRQFQWHVYSIDPDDGHVLLTTNPKGVGRLSTMTREEWDALKTPGATAAATPSDVPIQPPLGFVSNPHVVASGHTFPADIPRDGLFHVTTAKNAVMEQGFRGSNAGAAAAADIPRNPEIPQYRPGEAPLEPGMIRAYHYTGSEEALAGIRKDGLQMQHAKGETYQEPNQIWFSTSKPNGEDKAFVEVHLRPEELTGSGGAYKSDIATPEKAAAFADHKNATGANFAVIQDIPADRIVTHSEPWHHHYNTFVDDATTDPVAFEEQFGMFLTHPNFKDSPLAKATRIRLDELKAAVPEQLQGIGSVGDDLNKGRVSFVTSAVRAQAYHDRLLLAVRAARGEITNAEVADYFIPLYQKAYGDDFAQRMKDVLADQNLLEGSTHTPQELVWMVKRLDDGLIGGSGGVSPGGMKTGLTSAEGAVHLTSKAEQLAKIDPEQIGTINLATREGAVANKGVDVGELTLLPEDLHPMSIAGDTPSARPAQYVVDPAEQAKYDAGHAEWKAEQDAIGEATREYNQAMERHTYAQLAHENDKINYARDMKDYERMERQYVVLQKEYNDVVAANKERSDAYAKGWAASQRFDRGAGPLLDDAEANFVSKFGEKRHDDFVAGWSDHATEQKKGTGLREDPLPPKPLAPVMPEEPIAPVPPFAPGSLFHGSPNAGLKSASADPAARQFDNATSQFGAFTTPDKATAERYAGEGGKVYEAVSAPKNPYPMSRKEFDHFQSIEKDASGATIDASGWAARAEELKTEAIARRKELAAQGYDGVIVMGNKGNPTEVASFKDVPLRGQRLERPQPPKMMELKQEGPLPPSSNKFPASPDFPDAEMVPVSQLKPYREVDRALMGRTGPTGEAPADGTIGEAIGYNHAEYLGAMVEEIKANGFKNMGPVTFEYDPVTGTALLTDGNHRLAAAEVAGVREVPVVVKIVQRTPGEAADAAPKGFKEATKYRPETPTKVSDLLQARMTPQEFWDKGIIDMLEQRAKTGPHPNPDVEGALQKVAELTQRVLKDSKGAKNTRNTVRELGKAIPLTNPVPYNRSHVLIQHLLQTKIEDSQRDIFRLAEMQTQRTVLERSLNHPLFGLYPSSYMWGKVLPETMKFLAKNPYASTYIINDVQRAIAIQREYDPEFEDKMSSVDRSAGAYLADYLTPSLPWSDHSARQSPMVKDLMKGDLVNILPDELATMNPKRWYDQILRTMLEVPGAVETITGGNEQAAARPAWATGLSAATGAPAAPGGAGGEATPEQISGAVKAAALAPIIMDDMSRLQSILLGGQDAGN